MFVFQNMQLGDASTQLLWSCISSTAIARCLLLQHCTKQCILVRLEHGVSSKHELARESLLHAYEQSDQTRILLMLGLYLDIRSVVLWNHSTCSQVSSLLQSTYVVVSVERLTCILMKLWLHTQRIVLVSPVRLPEVEARNKERRGEESNPIQCEQLHAKSYGALTPGIQL